MIHLIVGNTGAGKTTYALELKKKNKSILFSIDKWNNVLFMPDRLEDSGVDWFLERIERAENLICDLIVQLESTCVDSLLDLGLSKQEHREKFRAFATKHNFEYQLHYLDIPKEERFSRISQRNEKKGETFEFEVTKENFEFMEGWFEEPTTDELQDAIVVKKT